ncbi:formate/nitrite transporter family protein [Uliginosibacterium sp. H3]|uniref:Formate/nitrite transporter family protein n=1 Tax=Uliginosibacterium silvisoli TaxID=3114758 RepID=A0ABU6JZK9_9RHOO|nr:formate/nitrite transporter family protein [Uliginosibacterium sp. H3]
MDTDTVEKAVTTGRRKISLLTDDAPRYWLRSVLAGMYLSIVVIVFWTLTQNLHDSPFGKVIASAFFGVGLSIIVFTNSELFTSNNMYLAASSGAHRTTWRQTAWLWTACWLGNFVGALLLSLLLLGAGVLTDLPPEHALHAGALHKAHQTATVIFFKGILANWVVCLAVWIALRVKEDITKIVAMILVVFMFLYLGFEHSIANMGTFLMSMLAGGSLSAADAAFNLVFSTAGNIVGGGLFIGLAYQYLSPGSVEEPPAIAPAAQAGSVPPQETRRA